MHIMQPHVPVKGHNWLSVCPDQMPITELLIPGTHDTMTAPCQDRYYRTQSLSLGEQLESGVRFLDIRLRQSLFAAHREWVSSETAFDIFETIKAFLQANPSEFVLMRIQNANEDKDDYPEYIQAIHQVIVRYPELLYQWEEADNPNPSWPSLAQARGKIVPLECTPPVLQANFQGGKIWAANWHLNPLIALQDLWDGPELADKLSAITTNLADSRQPSNRQQLFLNHLSATNGQLGFPDAYAEEINRFSQSIWEKAASLVQEGQAKYRGVQIYDFIDPELSRKVWQLNLVESGLGG